MSVVISVEGLAKAYRLGTIGGASLREDVSRWWARLRGRPDPFLRIGQEHLARSEGGTFWALRDVSFEVRDGEVLGIIGRNGAGKSTLLKVLSRVTGPTEGEVRLKGRIASLLEVGTGFHQELTGRENVFLNGAILGMTRAEIRSKLDEIVAFAEIEEFIDTPVKRYSSGMYVRLAFAVAAHLEPEILIVDEVLAVGDAAFQKKCLGKMKDVAGHGRTVLFVSHNMMAVQALCSRALVLQDGSVHRVGDVPGSIEAYLSLTGSVSSAAWCRAQPPPEARIWFSRARARVRGRQPQLTLEVEVELSSAGDHPPAFLAVDLTDAAGTALMQAVPRDDPYVAGIHGSARYRLAIALPPLVPGWYGITLWVGSHYTHTLDFVPDALSFEIADPPSPGRTHPHTRDHGWMVPSSTVEPAPGAIGDSP